MAKFKDPNPEWPVAVRKVIDGKLDTQYAHNDKDLAKLTGDPSEGGKGYTTSPIKIEWPKLMSHTDARYPDVHVENAADQQRREAEGYTFDHWDNQKKKALDADYQAAPPSFDPKAQARIDLLEKQLDKQSAQIDQLLKALDKRK
jgi:hypothetical protein